MDFTPSLPQAEICATITRLCARFDDDYWLAQDRAGAFPDDFHRALAEAGFLGIAMPEAVGGAGLGITELKTRAERQGDSYVIHGRKIWISTAGVADRMLLLARTTPLEQVRRKTEGLSLFYTRLDRRFVEARRIEKMRRNIMSSGICAKA